MGTTLSTVLTLCLDLVCGCFGFCSMQPTEPHARPIVQRSKRDIEQGKELFVRKWESHAARFGNSDGLGPLHNEVSCVACHSQGSLGGGGPSDKNVEIVALDFDKLPRGRALLELKKQVEAIHPAPPEDMQKRTSAPFIEDRTLVTSFMLHKRSTSPDYETWRAKFMSGEVWGPLPEDRKKGLLRRSPKVAMYNQQFVKPLGTRNGAAFYVSQRNSPALFGVGIIDRIPDQALLEVEQQQKKEHPEIAGRVAKDGRAIGRFGWRGQTASLQDFVLNACVNELGLNIAEREQPIDPFSPNYMMAADDMNPVQTNALVAYVENLPLPVQRMPSGNDNVLNVLRGEALFAEVGCAKCHRPNLPTAPGIYSDLLLHDMGASLGDPVPAAPKATVTTVQTSTGSSGSYGGGPTFEERKKIEPEDFAKAKREWRTPPLWGVADSAPYLHDGRAATLHETITLHDGQGAGAKQKYEALAAQDRANLLAFLETLTAPQQ